MRRRLALAQALLGDPRLLILDEPTAGLDPEQRLRFRELISELGEDRAILVSTHQTEDVAALCPRVVVLAEGRVLASGAPDELIEPRARARVGVAASATRARVVAWRTADGRQRQVGTPPAGAELVEPTLEDGYLLLLEDSACVALSALAAVEARRLLRHPLVLAGLVAGRRRDRLRRRAAKGSCRASC